MQRFDLLTSLPSRLSCLILQDWLWFKNVIRVDSAYCCHSHRHDFLELLQSDEYLICKQERVFVCTKTGSFYPKCPRLFKRFGEKIRSVEFSSEYLPPAHKTTMDEITNCCHSLTHVMVCGHDSNSEENYIDNDANGDNNCFTPELCTLLNNNPNTEFLWFTRTGDKYLNPIPFVHSLDDVVLPKLTTLHIEYRQIADEFILVLMKARRVIHLNLCGCEFKVPILSQIAALCPQLKKLDLTAALPVTDKVLDEVTRICPHILHLNISEAEEITDAGVLSVVQNLKKLQTLNISDVFQLTDVSLAYIYMYCASNLRTLWLDYRGYFAPIFSGSAINTLLERCTQLRKVRLSGGITPFVFSSAAICNLINLEIDCNLATQQNVATFSANGASLQLLRIIGNYEPTQDTVSNLVNGCPNLKELSMMVPLDPVESIPEYLTGAHWENIRPGLRIALTVVVPTEIIV